MRNNLPPPDASHAEEREGMRPPTGSERLEEKPFIEHLEDLRRTIIWLLCAFGCAFLISIPLTLKGYTLDLLKRPLMLVIQREGGPQMATLLPTLSPAGGIAVAMRVSAETALVISLPVIIYILGIFILPALTKRERRYFGPILGGGTLMFYAGMAFCYFTTLPWTIRFFWSFNRLLGIGNLWTINEYVAFVSRMLIAFGLVFEFPLIVLLLVRMGVLNYRLLSEKRRYVIVLAFILAAVLTPGPDVVSQIVMAVPLLLLYELCVWGARLMEKRRARLR
jgi:sec-independent protein translocase protein TatC